MLRLIGMLLLIPLLDMLLLVGLTQVVPWTVLVLVVVLTGLIGMLLVRAEGRHTLRRFEQKLARGEIPTDEVVDGGLLLVAGAALLTPGLVTDALGFLLVIPFTRYPVRVALEKWVVTPYVDAKTGGLATGGVYIGGFPPEGDDAPGGFGPAAGGSGSGGPDAGGPGSGGPDAGGPGPGSAGDVGEETVDLDEDAYDVEFDDESN